MNDLPHTVSWFTIIVDHNRHKARKLGRDEYLWTKQHYNTTALRPRRILVTRNTIKLKHSWKIRMCRLQIMTVLNPRWLACTFHHACLHAHFTCFPEIKTKLNLQYSTLELNYGWFEEMVPHELRMAKINGFNHDKKLDSLFFMHSLGHWEFQIHLFIWMLELLTMLL